MEGAHFEVPNETVPQMIMDRVRVHADDPGFLVREAAGGFRTLTWREVGQTVREVAAGLVALGLEKGDRVAIVADTRAEWAFADFGTLTAGGVTVTVYPTLTREQVRHLLADSGARFVVMDSVDQYRKVAGDPDAPRGVEAWITLDDVDADALAPSPSVAKRSFTLDDVRRQGRSLLSVDADVVMECVSDLAPDDPSTIIYTSGTTGVPKGAVLSHRHVMAATRSAIQAFDLRNALPDPSVVLYLPLAHTLTRFILVTAVDLGARVAFSSPRTLGEDAVALQPTLAVNVPRIYERMYGQMRKAVAAAPPARQRLFARAEAVADAYGRAIANGGRAPLGLRVRHAVFDRLVYRKLRERFGFARVHLGFSASAAIRPELLHFFQGIGARVVEAWGMTETATPGTVNPPDRFKPGTVGTPFPGVSVMLDDDGELLVAGPNVFDGYHGMPEESEASFVTRAGRRWFRTGDIAEIDSEGYVRIVDRKKEIEVLDTGKKIAPVTVEEAMKGASPFIAEACVVATGRKFAGALVQADFDALVTWASKRGIAFDEKRVVVKPDPTGTPMTYAVGDDLLAHPDVVRLFEEEVAKGNARCAPFEHVKVFHLVPHAFTIDRDELTPTLKKKRRVICARYAKEIDAMFAPAA